MRLKKEVYTLRVGLAVHDGANYEVAWRYVYPAFFVYFAYCGLFHSFSAIHVPCWNAVVSILVTSLITP
jgi:hypothetical protein